MTLSSTNVLGHIESYFGENGVQRPQVGHNSYKGSVNLAFLSADMELTCKTTFIEDFKRVSQCVDVPSCFVKHH